MQASDNKFDTPNVELHCLASAEEDADQLVIFELVVPGAAKVPAPCQHVELAKLVVQPASVSSTVPGTVLTLLSANNTALGSAWCITATLAAPQPRARY